MANLIDLIKTASVNAVNSNEPTSLVEGVVEKISPLTVKLNQRISISGIGLIKPKHLKKYEFTVNGEKLELDLSLKAGDTVYLLKNAGGQTFYILGVKE